MQKIKMGPRSKFRHKEKLFPQVLFPVRAILRCIFSSGVLRALVLIDIRFIQLMRVFLVSR